jgi:hypothetical protein
MDWEAAFDRLTEELDPYHELLRFGRVSAEVDDPDAWRGELRRQARRDKIPIRSFASRRRRDGKTRVWAGKAHVGEEELRAGDGLIAVQREAAGRAQLNGHAHIDWIRVLRGEEAAGRCRDCGGRVYAARRTTPPTIDGDVFDRTCG